MSVINITIIPSSTQILPGIPQRITLTASEPSIIFYTLNGLPPDTSSTVYTAPILIPEITSIILSVFATNGTDYSAVITQQYNADISQIQTYATDRLPHSAITGLTETSLTPLYPFGSNTPSPNVQYENPSLAGTTVYDESQASVSQGFDSNENPAVFTNQPQSYYQFNQQYSTTDSEGQVFPGVGNLPAPVEVIGSQYDEEYRQEISTTADKLFNPRALVIYQDTNNEDPTNPVIINRGNFSLESPEVVRDGDLLYNSGVDLPPTMGSFVNRYYNSRTNSFTSYYYDNTVNRWIISTTPYQPTDQNAGALYNMVFSRPPDDDNTPGTNALVFKWFYGFRRVLI